MRSFVSPKQDDWDDLLPLAEFAIDNTVNRSTGYTLFYLNSGQHPFDPVSSHVHRGGRLDQRGIDRATQLPAVIAFYELIANTLKDAKSNLKIAQDRSKSEADSKRRDLCSK